MSTVFQTSARALAALVIIPASMFAAGCASQSDASDEVTPAFSDSEVGSDALGRPNLSGMLGIWVLDGARALRPLASTPTGTLYSPDVIPVAFQMFRTAPSGPTLLAQASSFRSESVDPGKPVLSFYTYDDSQRTLPYRVVAYTAGVSFTINYVASGGVGGPVASRTATRLKYVRVAAGQQTLASLRCPASSHFTQGNFIDTTSSSIPRCETNTNNSDLLRYWAFDTTAGAVDSYPCGTQFCGGGNVCGNPFYGRCVAPGTR